VTARQTTAPRPPTSTHTSSIDRGSAPPFSAQTAVDAAAACVRLAGDRPPVPPPNALPEDPAVARLQAHVEPLRPHAQITDLLADIDARTPLTGQLGVDKEFARETGIAFA